MIIVWYEACRLYSGHTGMESYLIYLIYLTPLWSITSQNVRQLSFNFRHLLISGMSNVVVTKTYWPGQAKLSRTVRIYKSLLDVLKPDTLGNNNADTLGNNNRLIYNIIISSKCINKKSGFELLHVHQTNSSAYLTYNAQPELQLLIHSLTWNNSHVIHI